MKDIGQNVKGLCFPRLIQPSVHLHIVNGAVVVPVMVVTDLCVNIFDSWDSPFLWLLFSLYTCFGGVLNIHLFMKYGNINGHI